MIAASDPDRLIADALTRVPVGAHDKALELGSCQSAVVAGRFTSVQSSTGTALGQFPTGTFQFIAAAQAFEGGCSAAGGVLRQVARLLCEHGVVCARFQKRAGTQRPRGFGARPGLPDVAARKHALDEPDLAEACVRLATTTRRACRAVILENCADCKRI